MSLNLDYFTSGAQPITSWSFGFGIPAPFNFKGVRTGSYFVIAFRYLESFTKSRYVSKWKPFLMFLYNSNLGNLLKFCILDHQCSTKKLFRLFLTSLMTTVGSSMSKLYFSAISLIYWPRFGSLGYEDYTVLWILVWQLYFLACMPLGDRMSTHLCVIAHLGVKHRLHQELYHYWC